MDTTLSFLGNNTTLVEIGIVLVIAAAVMGLWQAIKSLRSSADAGDAASAASVASAVDMRRQHDVRLEA